MGDAAEEIVFPEAHEASSDYQDEEWAGERLQKRRLNEISGERSQPDNLQKASNEQELEAEDDSKKDVIAAPIEYIASRERETERLQSRLDKPQLVAAKLEQGTKPSKRLRFALIGLLALTGMCACLGAVLSNRNKSKSRRTGSGDHEDRCFASREELHAAVDDVMLHFQNDGNISEASL